MKTNSYSFRDKIVLASIAGVIDRPFWRSCRVLSAIAAVTEIASANPESSKMGKIPLHPEHGMKGPHKIVPNIGIGPRMQAAASGFFNIESDAGRLRAVKGFLEINGCRESPA